jgi:hypothetical protein
LLTKRIETYDLEENKKYFNDSLSILDNWMNNRSHNNDLTILL